jgi:hypothetical protein
MRDEGHHVTVGRFAFHGSDGPGEDPGMPTIKRTGALW